MSATASSGDVVGPILTPMGFRHSRSEVHVCAVDLPGPVATHTK